MASAPNLHGSAATGRRRARRVLFEVLASLMGLAAVVLLVELALRCWYPQDRFLSLDELDSHVRNAQGSDLVVDAELGCAPQVGTHGRDAQGILLETPAGTATLARHVLFLGDSVTRRGTIIRGLAALNQDPGLDYLNAGVDSWNPVQEIQFCFRHRQHERAQHVVLSFHNNDFQITPVGLLVDAQFKICMPGAQTSLNPSLYHASILYRLLVNARNRLLGVRPTMEQLCAEVESSLKRLRDELRKRGTRFTVLLLPNFARLKEWSPEQQQSRSMALDLLHRLEIETIDLLEPVQQLAGSGFDVREQPGDTWHPNEATGSAMALFALEHGLFPDWPPTARFESSIAVRFSTDRPRLRVSAGALRAGRQVTVFACSRAPRAGWWSNGMDLNSLMRSFLSAGGQLHAGTPATGRLDAEGKTTLDLPIPGPGAPAPLYFVAVVLTADGTTVEWVSAFAPLLCLG